MTTSTMKAVLVCLAAMIAVAASGMPGSAAERLLSDGAARANSYKTYVPGGPGCVDDLGYGRIKNECHGD